MDWIHQVFHSLTVSHTCTHWSRTPRAAAARTFSIVSVRNHGRDHTAGWVKKKKISRGFPSFFSVQKKRKRRKKNLWWYSSFCIRDFRCWQVTCVASELKEWLVTCCTVVSSKPTKRFLVFAISTYLGENVHMVLSLFFFFWWTNEWIWCSGSQTDGASLSRGLKMMSVRKSQVDDSLDKKRYQLERINTYVMLLLYKIWELLAFSCF